MQTVRELECGDEFAQHNFVLGSYKDVQNQERPEYLITRDGFTFTVTAAAQNVDISPSVQLRAF